MNDRFLRQRVLPEVGPEGQERFKNTRVLMVGAGGLGSPALLYLAASGVGTLGILDGDSIESSNLARQVLYKTSQVGLLKAETAARNLREFYPDVNFECNPEFLTPENAAGIFSSYDLILDGTDTLHAKALINAAAGITARPVIFASVTGMDGQLLLSRPGRTACWRCLFPAIRETGNCNSQGVLSPVAGFMGTLQAAESLKWILHHLAPDAPGVGELFTWNARTLEGHRFRVPVRSDCPACKGPDSLFHLRGNLAHKSTAENSCRFSGAIPAGILVDVRETAEWKIRSHPDALLCPLSELKAGTRMPPKTDQTLLLFCKTGVRAREAKSLLHGKGWKNIEVLTDFF